MDKEVICKIFRPPENQSLTTTKPPTQMLMDYREENRERSEVCLPSERSVFVISSIS